MLTLSFLPHRIVLQVSAGVGAAAQGVDMKHVSQKKKASGREKL
jgi:hypothetical protein